MSDFVPGYKSIDGLFTGILPWCKNPTLATPTGAFEPVYNGAFIGEDTNIRMLGDHLSLTASWISTHAGSGGSYNYNWYDLFAFPVNSSDTSKQYALYFQLGVWFQGSVYQFGARWQLKSIEESPTIIKTVPSFNGQVSGFQAAYAETDIQICMNIAQQTSQYYSSGLYYNVVFGLQGLTSDYNMVRFGGGCALNLETYNTLLNTTSSGISFTPGTWEVSDPNQQDEDGTNVTGGGGGTYHRIYESVPIPGLPTIGPGYAGSFRSFVLTNSEMRSFNEIMYGPTAWQAIKAYFTNPMDFFIGCLALPFYPTTLGRGKPVFNGAPDYVWEESYQMLADDWYELSCGSIDIQEYYGSCFDYDPYTSIQLWLPFIGYVSLSPDEVMGKTVGVTYHISVCTGDCVAFVHTGAVGETGPQIPRVIGQFNGNCAMQMPVVQTSFDAVIQSSMEMAAQVAAIAAGAITGGAGLIAAEEAGVSQAVFESRAVAQAGKTASQLAGATMSAVAGSKTKFAKNGGMAGAAGFMGVLKPHLVISTPRQSLPDNYINLKGYPSNISGKVGDFDGYLEVTDVRLNDIPATIAEIEEIYAQLKGGIII